MSTQSNSGYMLIFRGTGWDQGRSAGQMQQVADQRVAWFHGLKNEGTALAGNPLEREGRIAGKNRLVSDGRFVESRESIGGYFLLQVGRWPKPWLSRNNAPACPTASPWKCVPSRRSVPWWRNRNQKKISLTPDLSV